MDPTTNTADLRQIASDTFTHECLGILGFTILVWDHVITFNIETRHIWVRPKTLSAYLFFFHRYFVLFSNISVVALGALSLDSDSCSHYSFSQYNLYRQLLLVATQVIVCVLLTLRIYALYSRDKRIVIFLSIVCALLAALSIWALLNQKSSKTSGSSGVGCHNGLSRETAIHIAAIWEALFAYDSLLFGFTLYKTYQSRNRLVFRVTLISLIMRDGAIYFAVMALANLSNILTFYLARPFLRGGLSTFASCVSVTMMSRLILNLHECADTGLYTTNANLTTLIFEDDLPSSAHFTDESETTDQ